MTTHKCVYHKAPKQTDCDDCPFYIADVPDLNAMMDGSWEPTFYCDPPVGTETNTEEV